MELAPTLDRISGARLQSPSDQQQTLRLKRRRLNSSRGLTVMNQTAMPYGEHCVMQGVIGGTVGGVVPDGGAVGEGGGVACWAS